MVLANIKAPKNGFAYVYLSNESNESVYFDDFKVSDTRGRIIEEDHYYAFGLKIAGISSVKMGDANEGSLKNNYQYQGDYSEMDEDIGWNDFALRNYDPQVGKWIQQDPFDQFSSPYSGMGNDPVNNIDPSGGWAATGLFEGMSQLGIVATTTIGGAIVGGAIDLMSGGSGGKGLLYGAALGAGSNFGADLNIALDIFRNAVQIDNRIIMRSLNDLTDKLNNADGKLNRWNEKDKDNFKNHFGTNDNTAKSIIKERVTNEKDLILKYRKNNSYKQKIKRDNGPDYAHVSHENPGHNVHLENKFWKAKRKGTNSKYGTFAHELSHFDDIGPTHDFNIYGADESKNLRDLHNGKVLNHADSFEYYIENAF